MLLCGSSRFPSSNACSCLILPSLLLVVCECVYVCVRWSLAACISRPPISSISTTVLTLLARPAQACLHPLLRSEPTRGRTRRQIEDQEREKKTPRLAASLDGVHGMRVL